MTSKIRREIRRRGDGQIRAPTVQFEGVSGSLRDMTALDIIQSLELGRKTAHLVLQYENGRSGELRIDNGQVCGGVSGSTSGEPVFYELMRPGPGLFRIEYRESPLPRNILKPNTYLMIEAMRRVDESPDARLSRPLPITASGNRVQVSLPAMNPDPSMRPTVPSLPTPVTPAIPGLSDDLVLDPPVRQPPVPITLDRTPPRPAITAEDPAAMRRRRREQRAVGRLGLRRLPNTPLEDSGTDDIEGFQEHSPTS